MKNLGLLAVLILVLCPAGPALADIYSLINDQCNGTCGGGPYGTIYVTQNGTDTVHFDVILASGAAGFVHTGAGSAFEFNIIGNPTISVTKLNAGWSLISPIAGNLKASAFGDLDYELDCLGVGGCAQGGSGPDPGPLTFDVTAPPGFGLTPASFPELSRDGSQHVYFTADIMGSNGKSGNVGALGSIVVPEPASILGLGTVLLLVGSRLRRKKA